MPEGISSIIDLFDRFETEEDCVRYIYDLRTQDGWTCPKCGAHAPSLLLSRRKIQCTRCSQQEAVTKGTAMEASHIKLRKWFVAIYLIANDKRGVSASYLAHELRIQWNSAYYLLERIRAMMAETGVPSTCFPGRSSSMTPISARAAAFAAAGRTRFRS